MEENGQNQQNKTNENEPQNINIDNNSSMPYIPNGQTIPYNQTINPNQNLSNINNLNIQENGNQIPQNQINVENCINQLNNINQIEEMNNINIGNNMNMKMNQNMEYNEQYINMQRELLRNQQYQGQFTMEQIRQQMEQQETKNIYDYTTDKSIYGIAFQNSNSLRLAISSMEKSLNNKVEILELINNDLRNVYEQKIDYPCTKLLWNPRPNESSILATSGEYIQLYNYDETEHILKFKNKLNNKKSKFSGALTSFDWNTVNNALLGTASIDTTCTIWDLNKGSIKTQLIAHDKEVFDIQFDKDENVFISGGADGSVRLFDLRALNHSTIIYETKEGAPIIKLAWNLHNSNIIAALSMEKNVIYIFDSRANTNISMDELNFHKEPVTGIVWSPDSPSQLCSVSEDCCVVISNIQNEHYGQNNNISYNAKSPINNIDWCKSYSEWIGIAFKNNIQLLRK